MPKPAASKRARAVWEAALRRRQSERVAFIDGACGEDEPFREEVIALLDSEEIAHFAADRCSAIVESALERRRTERVAFVEGACGGDEDLKQRVLAALATAEATANPAVRVIKPVVEPPTVELPVPLPEPEIFRPAVSSAPVSSPAVSSPAVSGATISVPGPSVPESSVPNVSEPASTAAVDEEPTRVVRLNEQSTRAGRGPEQATRAASTQSPTWRPGQPMEGRRIGPYQLLHSLGKGGMGSVYAASRADQEYKKIVAIKLVTSGLDSEEMLRRFRNERQVLAGLDHPYIARLLDGGSTDDGLPYLVMEFVEGLPIDKYCEAHELSVAERLKLFQKVCSAVHFAHQNLVVHRDLKPGNIMVRTNGEPKLLDFGIAKLMTAEFSAEDIELSRGEAQPMTLRYASPEQVRNQPITTESDIYSLGVLLYELLAGAHPFQTALTSRAEITRAILCEDPEKPSVAVTRRADLAPSAKREKQSATKLAQQLSGDIDCIVLMALQKQPRGRYSSAESFALDITRYLNGFPVHARRDDMGYRARKFIRRHAASVIGAVLVVIALIASSVVSLEFAKSARAEHRKAQSRFEDVRKLARFVLFDFDEKIRSGPTQARKVLVTEALDYLNRMAKDTGGDVSLERELIDGYLKVGDLQGNPNGPNIGDLSGAKQSYGKALQVAEGLRAKNPADIRSQEDVARVNMKLGDLSEYANSAEALKNYRQAQAILQTLTAVNPAAKSSLVKVFEKIGTVQLLQGDTYAALGSFKRYLQIAQELLDSNRGDARARRRVALAYYKLGETMANTGDVSGGLEHLRRARSIYQELSTSPRSPARSDVAGADMLIGRTLYAAGKPVEAVQSYQEALSITESLSAEDPRNKSYKSDLSMTLKDMADALFAAGKTQEARQATEHALQVLGPMLDAPEADYEIYQYCWLLVTTPFRDLQAPARARYYAEQLVQSTGGKDPDKLDLLARAYDAAGDSQLAVATENKALALFPPNSTSSSKAEFEKNLAKFRARAERKQAQ